MDIEIRPIGPEEFEPFMRALSVAFGLDVAGDELARERLVFEPARGLAVYEAGEIVAGIMASSLEVSVPGALLPAACVTSAGVIPTHRRRGLLRALMRRHLDDVRASGEPVSALWSSESGIYGRFGYAPGNFRFEMEIDRNHTSFARPPAPGGRVRLLGRERALEAMPAVYERVRGRQPGTIGRDPRWWQYLFHEPEDRQRKVGPLQFAAYESPRGVDGYVVYRFRHAWRQGNPAGTVEVQELIAATTEAEVALWRYCFDVDLSVTIRAWNRSVDEPLLFTLADPRRLRLRLMDGMWVRLVDVPAALRGRRYGAAGRIVLEVRDAFCPWNEGGFELEGGRDGAACRPSTASPDLVVDVTDLAAAYLGGTRLRTLHRATRVAELTAGALDRADAMFAWDPPPWCPHMF